MKIFAPDEQEDPGYSGGFATFREHLLRTGGKHTGQIEGGRDVYITVKKLPAKGPKCMMMVFMMGGEEVVSLQRMYRGDTAVKKTTAQFGSAQGQRSKW